LLEGLLLGITVSEQPNPHKPRMNDYIKELAAKTGGDPTELAKLWRECREEVRDELGIRDPEISGSLKKKYDFQSHVVRQGGIVEWIHTLQRFKERAPGRIRESVTSANIPGVGASVGPRINPGLYTLVGTLGLKHMVDVHKHKAAEARRRRKERLDRATASVRYPSYLRRRR